VIVGRLANSPERFELVDMGFTSATFSWLSDTLTDSQLTYRLHYKSSSDEVYSFIEVRVSVTDRCRILVWEGHWRVVLVSGMQLTIA